MTMTIEKFEGAIDELAPAASGTWLRSACGITRAGSPGPDA